jgi:MFS transporter, PPP family, 3-phenylpropionic acid transporter
MCIKISLKKGGGLSDRFGSNRIILILTIACGIIIYFTGRTTEFYSILALVLVLSLFQSPVSSVMDGMSIGYIRSGNNTSTYGQFRWWGSAGFASASFLSGILAGAKSSNIFILSAVVFGVISVINLITLPPKPVTGRGLVNFKSFGVFFRNRKVMGFFILIFLFGVSISPLHHFINLYFTEIGASRSQIGIAFAIQASFEIPFFLYGARYVKKYSPESIIILAMIISVFRLVLYGAISNPSIAIYIGTLHGFTISFFLIGVIEYVQSHTPSHLRTTSQSLIWAFHFGAGLTVGNIWIGYLKDIIGMQKLMHVQAAIASVVVILVVLFFRRLRVTKK